MRQSASTAGRRRTLSAAGVRDERLAAALVGLAVAAGMLALGWARLALGHPEEDAYILFRYAEHLANGDGCVFNVGGPRAEGATDFLWLVAVSGLVRLGADVALASLALNAAAGGLVAAWLALGILRSEAPAPARLALLAIPLALPFGHGALAAYAGFGSMGYSALYALALGIGLRGTRGALVWLPAVGLALGLVRPDGVLPGVAFALLGLALARRAGLARRYLAAAAASAGVGAAYFLGRWAYFGMWLPLPLYVKSRPRSFAPPPGGPAGALAAIAERLPGLAETGRWLGDARGPLPLLLVLLLLLALSAARPRAPVRRLLAFLLPGLLLVAELCVGQQSQNFAHRFQAPATLMALVALAYAAPWALARHPRRLAQASILAAALLAPGYPAASAAASLWRWIQHPPRSYVDSFAPALGAHLGPGDVFALTEAGAFPYWTRARVEDLVGLNSPHTAITPPDGEYLAELDPVVLLFDHVLTLDPRRLVDPAQAGQPLVAVPPARLLAAVRAPFRPLLEGEVRSYRDPRASAHLITQLAPILLCRFLAGSDRYLVFAVDSARRGSYHHVIALRRGWPRAAEVLAQLADSLSRQPFAPYLALAAERRARAGGPG